MTNKTNKKKLSRIYVAGHRGLIGSAMIRRLQQEYSNHIITCPRSELDLTNVYEVDHFFDEEKPEYVILAAGRVGGIVENQKFPVELMETNLAIQFNVLRAAHRVGVKKLILFASSCMYPRECPQPMSERALLTGSMESTSLAYAISKLTGMQLCLSYNQQYGSKCFIPVIPNSTFGPNDNFDVQSGHVLSALIRRFHEGKVLVKEQVELWGSGQPRREFIHADDVADAVLTLLEGDISQLPFPINIGTGEEYSIRDLALKIADIAGYKGKIVWNSTKPDGAPQKMLDSSRLFEFGWRPKINFTDGLYSTYQWYLNNQKPFNNQKAY